MEFADRLQGVPSNEIRQIVDDVDRLKSAGHPVLSFLIGRPDFDTPFHIKEAAKKALDAGFVHYVHSRGIPDLRAAISRHVAMRTEISYDPDTEVLVTAGAVAAIAASFQALLATGDEVLLPEPAWNTYTWAIRLAGGIPVPIPLSFSDKFQINPDDLDAAVSPRTRIIIVNTPHNPTGAVWDRERLLSVARIAEQRNLVVIADEIYDHFVYSAREHVSFPSLPGMRERTILVNGFSKTYSMTGWRLGYAVGPSTLIDGIMKIQQYFLSCVSSFVQKGAIEALEGSQASTEQMVSEFHRRRDLVVQELTAIEDVQLVPPEGSFYAFPSLARFGSTSVVLAQKLLREAHVALAPGSAYGTSGEGHLRLAFTRPLEELEDGLTRMAQACEGWRRR